MFPFPPHLYFDKTRWPEGPWQTEPDAVAWVDGKSKLNCAMSRHELTGTWRGYVAVDPLHPLHGRSYRHRIAIPESIRERAIEMWRDFSPVDMMLNAEWIKNNQAEIGLLMPAHGSITYAGEDTEGFWWFGFDCMHGLDIMPAVFEFIPAFWSRQTYRDHDYVHGIVTRLASAIIELGQLVKSSKCCTD